MPGGDWGWQICRVGGGGDGRGCSGCFFVFACVVLHMSMAVECVMKLRVCYCCGEVCLCACLVGFCIYSFLGSAVGNAVV
jgi:hypothetical protein